jgi:uncharacterized protein YjbI with pentapeptide repeats
MEVCDHPATADRPRKAHVEAARRAWCDRESAGEGSGRNYDGDACGTFFADLDRRFDGAWQEERVTAVANRDRPDLDGRDLRRAQAAGVSLVGADLQGARLEGADLQGARLEGADLGQARLEGADLGQARLKGADLGQARLEGTNLWQARLEGATLLLARLEGANLWWARLEGANLLWARLEGANLSWARLEGANLLWARLDVADLDGARLEGANLIGADFRSANWARAHVRSPAQFADFRGAQGLTQAQLDHVIGDAGTLLPVHPAPDTGKPYRVWTCWTEPPENLDALLEQTERSDEDARAALRAEWLCGPDNPRRPTGTPLALDAPYPDGHPLANRPD